jgi:hypothetical protein
LALAAGGKLFANNIQYGVNLPIAITGYFESRLVTIQPLQLSRSVLKVLTVLNFAL